MLLLPHKMFSRLDYFLLSAPLLAHTVSSDLGPITWSDHTPLTLDLCLSAAFPRRLNESLLKYPETKNKLDAVLTEYFQLNTGSVSSLSTLWESHKAFIRGQCISVGSLVAERSLIRFPTVGWLRTVTSLCNRIKSLDMSTIDKLLL